jgi:hypothetical protein
VGALRYRGPGVADSFFRDPDQSALHFRAGWFYPGDLAELDADGYVYLRGRSKDMTSRRVALGRGDGCNSNLSDAWPSRTMVAPTCQQACGLSKK